MSLSPVNGYLKLSQDQAKKIHELLADQEQFRDKLRTESREEVKKKMGEEREAKEKELVKVLRPEQIKRLEQITLQHNLRSSRRSVLENAVVGRALSLTKDQNDKVRSLAEDAHRLLAKVVRDAGESPGPELHKKISKARKEYIDRTYHVLTTNQKMKLRDLQGQPFRGLLLIGRPEVTWVNYHRVQRGMTEEEVGAILGKHLGDILWNIAAYQGEDGRVLVEFSGRRLTGKFWSGDE